MRALLILLLVPAFALGLAVGATRVVGQPTPPEAQPTGFIWADRVFVSGHDLDSWLKSRGSSYQQWAGRHPGLAETFPLNAKRALVAPKQSTGGGSEPAWWNVLLTVLAVGSAVTLVLYLIDQRRPGIWRELAHETGSLGRIRPDRSRGASAHASAPVVAAAETGTGPIRREIPPVLEQSLSTLRHGWRAVGPTLAHVPSGALQHGRAAASATRPLRRRIRHRYLPRIVFYAAAVILAFAVGAAISGYLN